MHSFSRTRAVLFGWARYINKYGHYHFFICIRGSFKRYNRILINFLVGLGMAQKEVIRFWPNLAAIWLILLWILDHVEIFAASRQSVNWHCVVFARWQQRSRTRFEISERFYFHICLAGQVSRDCMSGEMYSNLIAVAGPYVHIPLLSFVVDL